MKTYTGIAALDDKALQAEFNRAETATHEAYIEWDRVNQHKRFAHDVYGVASSQYREAALDVKAAWKKYTKWYSYQEQLYKEVDQRVDFVLQ